MQVVYLLQGKPRNKKLNYIFHKKYIQLLQTICQVTFFIWLMNLK